MRGPPSPGMPARETDVNSTIASRIIELSDVELVTRTSEYETVAESSRS